MSGAPDRAGIAMAGPWGAVDVGQTGARAVRCDSPMVHQFDDLTAFPIIDSTTVETVWWPSSMPCWPPVRP